MAGALDYIAGGISQGIGNFVQKRQELEDMIAVKQFEDEMANKKRNEQRLYDAKLLGEKQKYESGQEDIKFGRQKELAEYKQPALYAGTEQLVPGGKGGGYEFVPYGAGGTATTTSDPKVLQKANYVANALQSGFYSNDKGERKPIRTAEEASGLIGQYGFATSDFPEQMAQFTSESVGGGTPVGKYNPLRILPNYAYYDEAPAKNVKVAPEKLTARIRGKYDKTVSKAGGKSYIPQITKNPPTTQLVEDADAMPGYGPIEEVTRNGETVKARKNLKSGKYKQVD